jgi:hypothetical protein
MHTLWLTGHGGRGGGGVACTFIRCAHLTLTDFAMDLSSMTPLAAYRKHQKSCPLDVALLDSTTWTDLFEQTTFSAPVGDARAARIASTTVPTHAATASSWLGLTDSGEGHRFWVLLQRCFVQFARDTPYRLRLAELLVLAFFAGEVS